MSRETFSATRCLAVWLAVTAVAAGLVAWLAPDLRVGPGGGFDAVLVWACEAALAGCAGWLWLVTTVVTGDVLRGRPHASRAGVPVSLRRLVLGACGLALAGGTLAAPSYAAEQHPGHRDDVLAGLAVPDRATALSRMAAVFEEVRPHHHDRREPAEPAPTHQRVAVRPGDTLWALAARTLPPGAGDAQVAARWHHLYALNRAVIGADPDLIVPGQQLVLPTGSEEKL